MFKKLRAIFSEPDMTPFEGMDLTADFDEKAPLPLARRTPGPIVAAGARFEPPRPTRGVPSLSMPQSPASATGRDQVERLSSNRKIV